MLLLELHGVEASVNQQRARIERLCADRDDTLVLALTDPDRISRAWERRRRLLPRLVAGISTWAMAVAAVIPERLLAVFPPDEPPAAQVSRGSARVAYFAHAGTGVLHLFVGIDHADEREGGEALALVRRMLQRLRGAGGTLLRAYGPARHVLGEAEPPASALTEGLSAIQRSFDPKGIMIP